MKYYVGIDSGLQGGIAVIDETGILIVCDVMPVITGKDSRTQYDILEITNRLLLLNNNVENAQIIVAIEKAQITPVAGKNACFSMGFCYGMLQGILTSLRIPFKVISPKTWQAKIHNQIEGSDKKQRSIIYCSRKFPECNLKRTERSTKLHDGKADAICIAEYLRLTEMNI